MAWMHIEWQLTIDKPNDYDDEPGLRFAMLGSSDGQVWVHTVPTGLLDRNRSESPRGGRDVWSGTLRRAQHIPTEEDPFFAFAVQVSEYESSTPENRRKDDLNLTESLTSVCQEVVDSGGVPKERVVQAAAAAPRLTEGPSGVDDWIGSAAWVDGDYGRRIAPLLSREERFTDGEVIAPSGPTSRRSVAFPYGDAVYELEWEQWLVAGRLDEHSQFSLHGWSNASWVR